MTSAPTVSVITISHKDLDGLKRTVESVRAQRYGGRIEHIVIDGGSGATSQNICPDVSQASRIGSPSPTAEDTTR